MNYVFGKVKEGPHACLVKSLQGVEDDYELHKGLSRIDGWPDDAYFEMNEKFPDRLLLEDFVFNRNNVLLISEKLRDFLDQEDLKNNEVLPVTIFNHKGRAVKENYFILNQLALQDCIDLEHAVVRINNINPDRISSVRKLAIDEQKIDPEVALFRMVRYPPLLLFRRDLAEKVQQSGFTGIQFGEIEAWKGK